MQSGNIFSAIPQGTDKETLDIILDSGNLRIERIISGGHSTPPGQWYDQEQDEWVILLAGSAAVMFEGSSEAISLKPGDYVTIPAHRRHRVERTDEVEETIWLAVHYGLSTGERA
jgi:cupin 2 domain-containing protein